MQLIQINKLDPTLKAAPDLHTLRYTIEIPDMPARVNTFTRLLRWLLANPKLIHSIIAMILGLFASDDEPDKAA